MIAKTSEAICEYLKPTGHTVIPAYDSEEALQLFQHSSIDLVVLDIMLPASTGCVAKFSYMWLIPKDAEKPIDGRRKVDNNLKKK